MLWSLPIPASNGTRMTHDSSPHTSTTLHLAKRLHQIREKQQCLVLDGNNLDIAAIVAIARHGIKPTTSKDQSLAQLLETSVNTLADAISQNYVVYGVNTGFGGSADTRTNEHIDLQMHLIQFIQSGIITTADKYPGLNSEHESSHVMPMAWVRATIAARVNQNLRGHSAVRQCVLKSLLDLLHNEIIPLVPLRGSISASGDLMPMAYIAGAVMGSPDVFVQVGNGAQARSMPSSEALKVKGLTPLGLGPKEGLGLINGTAPSVAVASLVLYDTQQLALLSQILTAFTSECLSGNVEWALPFIHETRPHPGQIEVARNIRHFLKGSKFVTGLKSRKNFGDGLCQDRYSTRTAPQWIGPYLEDLLLAQRQLEVELNSTSDNPLIDSRYESDQGSGKVYSGGNFQATAVTSAMDKTRLAIQMIGRMLWSQVTEMIKPATNNGLEANLNANAEDNFTMKGIDINMSAYMSELAALAHPVSAHVMSAEMHNQGVNSLALISARRTMEAVDLLAHMSACHLYVSCQAIEIREKHIRFLSTLCKKMQQFTTNGVFDGLGLTEVQCDELCILLLPTLQSSWTSSASNSWKDRVLPMVDSVLASMNEFLATHNPDCSVSMTKVFKMNLHSLVLNTAESIFDIDQAIPPEEVAKEMGSGTAQLYTWVRSKLNIPTHYGLQDDPLYNLNNGNYSKGRRSIGSWVSLIYESLQKGEMMEIILDDSMKARD